MKFKQFRPNPFARSIYLHSQITMWGFAWHSQGLGVCRRNSARLTAAPREKTKTRTRSQIISEEKGVCVCVCVCVCVRAKRGLCLGRERTCSCLPVRCSVLRRGAGACGLPGAPFTCSRSLSSPMTAAVFQSMISEKGSSQPLLSITGTHAAWNTHTHAHIQSEAWTWSFTNTVTSG